MTTHITSAALTEVLYDNMDSEDALAYARDVVQGRAPELEHIIRRDRRAWADYTDMLAQMECAQSETCDCAHCAAFDPHNCR